MGSSTKNAITDAAFSIFAKDGYEAVSMRKLAASSGVALSSIYHFFHDKDVLLAHIFEKTNHSLGEARAELPKRKTAKALLEDRVSFQFDHIEKIVYVLKYYLHYRPDFLRNEDGYIPVKAYLHMDEVIHKGLETGEFASDNPVRDAKIMTHAINGFLLEYFPNPPTGPERTKLVSDLVHFLSRSLVRKEG